MISRSGFEFIREIAARRAGILFGPGLEYLLESRLLPLARSYKAASTNEFIRMLQGGAIRDPEQIVVEALVEKETSFFRDVRPFDTLRRNILPELITKRSGDRKLSIWSVGCSTGQEPYSIALSLREYFPDLTSWELQVMASDVSSEVLQIATAGLYNQIEVNRGLPIALLVKYFDREGLSWRIKDEIRRMVQFSQINILDKWPAPRGFDVIFVRNVIGTLDKEIQTGVLTKIRRRLKPDGYLFLGGKEAPPMMGELFEEVRFDKVVVFRPRPGAAGDDESEEGEEDPMQRIRSLENWAKLAHMATLRIAADAPEIIEVLTADEGLKSSLQSAVHRESGSQSRTLPPLEEAMASARKEQIFSIALASPVAKALNESFYNMLSAGVEAMEVPAEEAEGKEQIIGAAKFSGRVAGKLSVRFVPQHARGLTVEALGLNADDVGPEVVNDLIGQVVSLLTNTLNSNFESIKLSCKLEGVEVALSKRTSVQLPPKAALHPLAFQFQGQPIYVDILITSVEQK